MQMGYGMMNYYGFGILGMIFWILVIIGLALLIKYLLEHDRHNRYDRGSRRSDNTPLEILNKRYASGEINKEEFEEKKRDLI